MVISLASKAFKSIGLKNYKFQISNRKILSGLLEYLKVDSVNEVMILIDKFDKIGEEVFKEELDKILDKEKSDVISKFINISGSKEEVIKSLELLNINNDKFNLGIKELKDVSKTLELLGVQENEFLVNLKIIRGLDYYTGTVFETLLVNNEGYGSICSGGRYDNLAENYTNNILPGVGISIGLTRLFFVLKEIGFVDTYKLPSTVEYLIIPVSEINSYIYEVYNKLISLGKTVEIYFEKDKLKKKMNYANKFSIPNTIIIGEEEEINRTINLKDMNTGLQSILKLDDMNI